ncbi:hypothetical protein ANN_22363 [Periplaneta americana]|uniref:Per a allergen n=1 Tax=Periplaneta americana TaxID=6978 RepID=A0ABQ8S7Y2_PERAM|nr:hypothetical protein ANN_22363 [Periplaneta americana]
MVIYEGDNGSEVSPGSSADSYPAFALIGQQLDIASKALEKSEFSVFESFGCVTSLKIKIEQRIKDNYFGNATRQLLKSLTQLKQNKITGDWRKLYNAELQAFYSSPDIIRNIKSRCLRWAGHVARMSESRNAYRVLVGRLEGKRSLTDKDRESKLKFKKEVE